MTSAEALGDRCGMISATNLRLQLTGFVGREQEKGEVKRLLATARLLTLTGAGGVGKTRLALQVASEVVEQFADGVWVAELAPLADPTLVPYAVASALNVRAAEQPIVAALVDYFQPRRLLLILDNCEHVIAACASLAEVLLGVCPNLRLLATSREVLRVAGETVWRVPSLSLPDPRYPLSVDRLTDYEAVRLFEERVTASQPAFRLTARNASAVVQICHRLGGIPLALELAAARTRVLTVEQMAAKLDDRFRLLTGGSRTAPRRHQTLRAVMDWSYALLSEQERIVLHRLSAFAGGWTLDAAEVVCGGDGIKASGVLDLLTRLVEKSLVVADTHGGEARYFLLETVRQYAHDRLAEAGEAAAVGGRHRDWYLGLVEQADPELRGPQQLIWLERLETEYDNLRAALDWSLTDPRGAEAGVRLAAALSWFWLLRGYLSEGRRWLAQALERGAEAARGARAAALFGAGHLAWYQRDYTAARRLLEESLAIFQEIDNKKGVAQSLQQLGMVELGFDPATARGLLEKSVALYREMGERWWLALANFGLGSEATRQGEYDRARDLHSEALAIFREIGDRWGIARPLRGLGLVAYRQGDYARARALLEESLAIRRALEDNMGIALALTDLVEVTRCEGDDGRMTECLRESLVRYRDLGVRWGVVRCLERLALAAAQDEPERAARLAGAAEALARTIDQPPAQFYIGDDGRPARVSAALEQPECAAAWTEGQAMTWEQAIQYALASTATTQERAKGTPREPTPIAADPLTPREREVAALVARGLTNRQIASSLVISERTADAHVQHILDKLGFNARAQIAAWVVERGLRSEPTD